MGTPETDGIGVVKGWWVTHRFTLGELEPQIKRAVKIAYLQGMLDMLRAHRGRAQSQNESGDYLGHCDYIG